MTPQEVFDKNWQHFVVERNHYSYDREARSCAYEDSDGCCCAIGLLLTRPLLDRIQEEDLNVNATVEALFRDVPGVAEYFTGIPTEFLRDLQQCHDDASMSLEPFHTAVTQKLQELARKYQLQIPGNPPPAPAELPLQA